MAIKATCAERIREALKNKDMTQAELCRLTGIPKSAMSQYCNGGLVPRQDRTYLIAQALNVSEAWLMGFEVPVEREEKKSATISGDGLSAKKLALIKMIGDLDDADVDIVRAATEALIARQGK